MTRRVPAACNHMHGLQAAIEMDIPVVVMLCNGYVMEFTTYSEFLLWQERSMILSRSRERWKRQEWSLICAGMKYAQYTDTARTAMKHARIRSPYHTARALSQEYAERILTSG